MKIFIFSIIFVFSFAACKQKNSIGSVLQSSQIKASAFAFQSKDFDNFYEKFINDTVFQLSRVKFPIEGNYEDYAGEYNWAKEKWPALKWDLRKEIKNTTDSVFIEQTDTSFFFGTYCRDCGFSFEMAFKNIDGEWFMTLREENNY